MTVKHADRSVLGRACSRVELIFKFKFIITYRIISILRKLRLTIERTEACSVDASIRHIGLLCLDPNGMLVVVEVIKALYWLSLNRWLQCSKLVLLSIVKVLRELSPISLLDLIYLVEVRWEYVHSCSTPVVSDACLVGLLVMNLSHVLGADLPISVVPEVTDVNLGLELGIIIVLAIEA